MAAQANGLQALSPIGRKVPVDAHVHFHRRHLVLPTLEAALANFSALDAPGVTPGSGILLLAQSAHERVYEWIRTQERIGGWSVSAVPAESQCLRLRGEAGEALVVCGRQIVAEPGLEVLALGTDQNIDDGLGLERTLRAAQSAGAIAVLPWGFGKWTGRRELRIREQLSSPSVASLWFGDNGGRLRSLPRPQLLDEAERCGFGVLPGSDPFPFGGDYRRVGGFGCWLEQEPDSVRPWESIRSALGRSRASPEPYGQTAGWIAFGLRQSWMQVHKRLGGRPA
jgi:hypothetical protein